MPIIGVMNLDSSVCYAALLARDSRHDGQFFTCVKTTGIYCRPVCPARPPLFKNCSFVLSAAAAQDAGFRPCLRCRPESSPGMGAWCGTSTSVQRALSLIEMGSLDEGDVTALAERLGMGDRHLRRLFQQHLGATPVAVAQTRRLLLAQQLIHETSLSMTDVALASGFGSVRRFNETFQALHSKPPSALRRLQAKPGAIHPGADIELLLSYRPPYDWPSMLGFLRARAIPGVELVDEHQYQRVIRLDGRVGRIAVSHVPERGALKVRVSFPKLAALPVIIARVRRVFDLNAEPQAIATALSADARLAPLVQARPGLRLPGAWDGFEIAVRAILGQQITVAGATRLAAKLVDLLGCPLAVDTGHPALSHAFPSPDQFTEEALSSLGMPQARRSSLVSLARAVSLQPHLFERHASLEQAVEQLRVLPGIGEWTAQYIAMRALSESDAFLAADVALQRIMANGEGQRPTARALLQRAEPWRPWRAYAVMHLWASDASAASATSPSSRTHHATVD